MTEETSEKKGAYSKDVQEVTPKESEQKTSTSVKKLNKKIAYAGVGGLTLLVVGLLVMQSLIAQNNRNKQEEEARLAGQEKPVEVDPEAAKKQADLLLEAQKRKAKQDADREAKQAQVEASQTLQPQVKDPKEEDVVLEAKGIAAFRQREGTSSLRGGKAGAQKQSDPWVAARQAFIAGEAQSYYQQRVAARGTAIFSGGGSPSDDGAQQATRQPVGPANSREELEARLQAAQRQGQATPLGGQGGMLTYTAPPSLEGTSQHGMKLASLPAGDAHQEAFYHQGNQIQAGYQHRAQATGSVDVQAGTVVHLALETGLSSELPGVIMARVTKPVYDPTLSYVSIPSGTKVIGTYNARVEKGQTRVQVSWTSLVWDGGGSYDLGGLPGVDLGGQSGFEADVDRHFDKALAGAALSGILSASASALAGPTNALNVDPRQQAIQGAAQPFQESGEALSKQYLDLPPTLSLEPGAQVGMLVSHDLVW